MSTARRLHYTYEDYLGALERSELKLEYFDGVIYAMAGGSPTHAELAAAAIRVLGVSLPTACRVYSSDLKIRIETADAATFPDVSVVCGPRETSTRDPNALVNPALLVEVTSRSTEDYDRGDKLSQYKQLPSLQVVLLVSHRTRRITVISRETSGWHERDFRSGERIVLDAPALTFDVDAIYDGVELEGQ